MIPEFNQYGYSPPGVHVATMEEIAERFGWQSELRQVQFESFVDELFGTDRWGTQKGFIEVTTWN